MRLRQVTVMALFVFAITTGGYLLVYLRRAVATTQANPEAVIIWHGDNFMRATMSSLLFITAVMLLGFLWVSRLVRADSSSVRIRSELVVWLESTSKETNESPRSLAERAIASYRAGLEAGSPKELANR